MKLLLAALAFTLSSSIALANTESKLKRLSCLISNGTTVETIGRKAQGVKVLTRLGFFSEEFIAALVVDEETENTSVELTDETGRVAYLLDLTIDLNNRKTQTRVGAVVRTGDGYVAPFVVASTVCDVTLR
jgi:hypothetical protein